MVITASRFHDFSCGHKVTGHESKCKNLHGHNYRIHFTINAEHLDEVGRVLDFSVIKEIFVTWIEREWDHKFLIWEQDPIAVELHELNPEGVLLVPFNPTAENMTSFILSLSPSLLTGTGAKLVSVVLEETRKCSVRGEI